MTLTRYLMIMGYSRLIIQVFFSFQILLFAVLRASNLFHYGTIIGSVFNTKGNRDVLHFSYTWKITIWKDICPWQKVKEALKLINSPLDELIAICGTSNDFIMLSYMCGFRKIKTAIFLLLLTQRLLEQGVPQFPCIFHFIFIGFN